MRSPCTRVPAHCCLQVLGGNGYVNDYPTGRILRDAKLYEIGAGECCVCVERLGVSVGVLPHLGGRLRIRLAPAVHVL